MDQGHSSVKTLGQGRHDVGDMFVCESYCKEGPPLAHVAGKGLFSVISVRQELRSSVSTPGHLDRSHSTSNPCQYSKV